jgi:alkylated DNA repair dioxygenase AlkB
MNITARLFDGDPVQLADDGEGGIRYWPACVAAEIAIALFRRLREGAAWVREQRPMYDRIVDVPRLQASLALDQCSNFPELNAALIQVVAKAPAAYTHVGLNLYRDGRDSVAMHNDRTHQLVEGAPIALLSLGDPRDMLIRRKGKGERATRITLEAGSLLVMSHASQFPHEHGIPKTSSPVGPRISCAFRVKHEETQVRSRTSS